MPDTFVLLLVGLALSPDGLSISFMEDSIMLAVDGDDEDEMCEGFSRLTH